MELQKKDHNPIETLIILLLILGYEKANTITIYSTS